MCSVLFLVSEKITFLFCFGVCFFFGGGVLLPYCKSCIFLSREGTVCLTPLFPKLTIIFCGLHKRTNKHLQTRRGAVQTFFHYLVSTVKKYFLILQ